MSNLSKHAGTELSAAAKALAAYQAARGLAPAVSNLATHAPGLAILADCSGSMREIAVKRQTREGMLRQALSDLWPVLTGAKLIGFNGQCEVVASPASLPQSYGTTDLAQAIRTAKGATAILVISDGQPNDMHEAYAAAKECGCPISVLFVGNPDDDMAIQFMKELAKRTGGKCEAKDLRKLASPLKETIKGLLPG
jgi:hypothetical protein